MMKILTTAGFVALVGVLLVSDTRAAQVVESKIALVRFNCEMIRLDVRQLQTSDALTRVGLGRNYEFVLGRLMTNMNSRLAQNQMDAGNLLAITASFRENLGYFRRNYIIYDRLISDLLAIDCTRRPEEFYEKLVAARWMRGEVRFNYTMLNQIMEEYMAELTRIEEELW